MGKMIKYLTWLCAISTFLVIATTANAQQLNISGQVTSVSDGESLPGVNIIIEGETSSGTVTNAQGEYQINASADDILRFSFVGFEALSVPVEGREVIDVELSESTTDLDEVVVMGYRTVSNREVSSSISQVDGEDLDRVTTQDPTEMLEGQMAGVVVSQSSGRPGLNADINIRGAGSISAETAPLYVIDGVIAGSGARDAVTPSNIESMTVLKDASATALYGSRASNGVVVITTKNGSPGDTQINVRSVTGFNTTLHGNETWMSGQELYDFHQSMANAENGPFYNQPEVTNINTNWRDVGFDTGVTQLYEASVSGGDDRTIFYVSGNFFEEEGTNIGTNYNKMSGRVNVQHKFNDNFSVSTKVAGNYSKRDNVTTGAPYTILTFSGRALPWDTPWNEDGSVRTGLESDWYSRDSENPLHGMQYNHDVDKASYFSGDMRLEYNFTDWANFTSTNRFSMRDGRREIYLDVRTQAGAARSGELDHRSSRSTSVITSNILHLNEGWETHSLNGLIGLEYQENRSEDVRVVGGGIAPGINIMDAAATAVTTEGGFGENSFASVLAMAEYGYDDRYITTVSFRRDGSSRFGANNRWGNFYSVGASWNISNESFMDNLEAIDQLLLRASYGTTGNAAIGNYEASGLYAFTSNYNGVPALFPSRVSNPNLTWEVAKTFNVGLDVDIMNRINMSLDVYRRDNENLLQNVTLPGTSGIDNRIRNVGTVRNNGIEFQISTTNIQSSSFNWTTDFTISANKNRVLELADGEAIPDGNQRIMEGEDINTYWMRNWHGVNTENGAPQWEVVERNEAGEITNVSITENYGDASLQKVGVQTPNFQGGFINTLHYGNFSLSAFLTYEQGALGYYSTGVDFGAYMTVNQRHLLPGESYWRQPGDVAHFPQPIVNGNNSAQLTSSLFLYDRSYIRLRNARLSYTLSASNSDILQSTGMQSARIYVSGDNLITFTDWPGRDPAASDNSYPLARSILIGIELGI